MEVKTMKKAFTLIAILVCLMLAGLILLSIFPRTAIAETQDNARIAVPIDPDWNVTDADDLYIVMADTATAYMAHKTTGTAAVNTTWANAAIEGGTQKTVDTASGGANSKWAVFDPPPLDKSVEWGFVVCEMVGGSVADTDTTHAYFRYNAETNLFFSNSNPTTGYKVFTLPR
jgi:hypothetical protein